MNIIKSPLKDVLIIEPKVFGDARGFFFESFNAQRFLENNIQTKFMQDNFSRSSKNVLRGLHYQLEKPQGKLVWVTRGQVLDVVVDIRTGSPTFGKSMNVLLDPQNMKQIYIPPGFAHGFCVLSEEADFNYKCTDYYDPPSERGILWCDPDLKIEWPVTDPILSPKDKDYQCLKDIPRHQLPNFTT
jgi:dTDP-4-dehydrorhamnose 3,5-epimerase